MDKKVRWIKSVCLVLVLLLLAGCGGTNTDETVMPTDQTEAPTEDPGYNAKPDAAEGYVHSHPEGTTVCYDLNGDGIGEDISVTTVEYEAGELTIGSAAVEIWTASPTGYFTVLNVNTADSTLLVGISDYGPSDDYLTVLYAYDGKKITEIGYFDDIIGENAYGYKSAVCHGNGIISATTRLDVLGTWNASCRYYADVTGIWDITEFYHYMDWEGNQSSWDVTAKADLIVCDEIGNYDTETTVPAGTSMKMNGIRKANEADSYWASFTVASTGETFWMIAQRIDWQTYVQTADGLLASEEAFDGFFYAG